MNSHSNLVTAFLFGLSIIVCDAAVTNRSAWASEGEFFTQQSDSQRQSEQRGRSRRWYSSENGKNHDDVKDAFLTVAAGAAASTVQILGDDKVVALGTIVEADGYIVSKASLLEGTITCRIGEDQVLPATRIGTDEEHDLVLLKVDATDLPDAPWRDGSPPPGSIVAALGTGELPLAVGVISTEARSIRNFASYDPNRGRLGISLGADGSSVSVSRVESDSGAEKAGLKIGDVVIDIDGVAMKSINQVVETVGNHRPGQTLNIRIRRDGKEVQVTATLGKPPVADAPEDNWGGGPFSLRRAGFPTALPHDVIIQPAQCGGPLVDTDGKVVGVNIARALRVSTFALPAETVQRLVQDIKERQPGL